METVKLKIPNQNNKLENDCFIHIGAAPAEEPTHEALKRIYSIDVGGGRCVLVTLFGINRIKFGNISSFHTYMSAAMPDWKWKKEYMKQFPDTNTETLMALYFYKRIED